MSRRRLGVMAAAAVLVLIVGGPASGVSRTVRIKDGPGLNENFFRPRRLVVERGTRVEWVNRGDRPHTTTSNRGLWNSDVLDPGEDFGRKFRRLGVFRYHCEIHSGMTGKIVVVA